jgi:hypothetical protein
MCNSIRIKVKFDAGFALEFTVYVVLCALALKTTGLIRYVLYGLLTLNIVTYYKKGKYIYTNCL